MAAKVVAYCSCYRSAAASPQLSTTINAVYSAIETLNTSTVKELSSIPGVGGTTARRVVEARNTVRKGHFTDLKQVLAVPRCGRRIVSQLVGEESLLKYHKLCCKVDVLKENDSSVASGTAKDLGHAYSEFQHPVCSPEVVSVDLGLSNAAWVHLNCNMEVIEWRRLSTGFPDPYNIEGAHASVLEFVGQLPDVSTYIIEAQSHRTSPAGPAVSGFIKIGLQLRILEALMYSSLKLKGKRVLSFQSKLVADIFDLKSLPRKKKKLFATGIVGSLLSEERGAATLAAHCCALDGHRLTVQQGALEVYEMEKKKDDLCDCLLQGIAFYECLMTSFILRKHRM